MKKLFKYIIEGISIDKNRDGSYRVFTIPTQHFNINSLSELTPERFELAILKFEERKELENKMFEEFNKIN